MRLCLVGTRRGSPGASALLGAIAHEARALGAEVSHFEDRFPPASDGAVCLYVPHEFLRLAPPSGQPRPEQLGSTIALWLERPQGAIAAASYANLAGAATFCVDRSATAELRRRGNRVEELRLGYTEAWDRGGQNGSEQRAIDVLFLQRRAPRRDRALASLAPLLWSRRCLLLGPSESPRQHYEPEMCGPPRPLTGEERLRAYSGAKTSLWIAAQGQPRFGWLEALQAIANGCVVVSEHCEDFAPLEPGRHLVCAERRNLGLVADALLRDPARREEIAVRAHELARAELPLGPSVRRLLEVAADLDSGPHRGDGPALGRRLVRLAPSLGRARRLARVALRPPPNPLRVERKRAALAEIAARRERALRGAAGAESDPRAAGVLARSASYPRARPRVSVLTPLYENRSEVLRALRSVAASEFGDYELLVLDDASTDEGVEAVRGFLDEHPWLPAMLLGRRVNQGLGRGRSEMARLARGDLLFMLDADNEVYPTALGRLVEALQEDPGAAFAYSMIEAHTEGRPRALLSALPWDPWLLRSGNYIDAMSMIRRDALLSVGGYSEDLRLHGWEDFDLWCRFAERGMRGRLVPEILCRYALSERSMLSITNLDSSEAWSLLRERHSATLGGAPLPRWPTLTEYEEDPR